MAEEKQLPITNTDDMSVLRSLLHSIQGISPVSTVDYVTTAVEED